MIKELPKYSDVFFVHYQCEHFEIGNKITSLSIFTNGRVIDFINETEPQIIYNFSQKVIELCNNGLIPIHWNQDRTYFSVEHIKTRYKELTGNELILEYINELNLAEWLIFKYGTDYAKHPRLDELAKLNNFHGITDKESRIFHTNRILLLTKIYFNALNETLKIERQFDASKTKKAKDYKDFIWFKTGLKLATGEAYDLYNKYKLDKGHFAKICFELGFKETDRTYFSSTINDNETDKNTFTDKDKLQKLHKHLTENNLPFGTEFLEKYNQIETE
jgi:hypothetical protein